MYRKDLAAIDCSTARALDIVGEWWSLMIVRECLLGTTRFDAFQRRLGIARNVLSSRLNHLVEHGILSKLPIEGERFFEYRLTEKGEALHPILVALMQWGDRWTGTGRGGPIRMVEDRSGKPIEWMGPRVAGGPALGYRDIRFEPTACTTERTRQVIEQRNSAVLSKASARSQGSGTKGGSLHAGSPRGAVLLLIDLQRAIDHPAWGIRNNPQAEMRIAGLLQHWRSQGWPVWHVRHDSTEPGSHYRPGQPGHEFKPQTAPIAGEPVIPKHSNSAFIGTDLEARLRAGGHEALVVAGVITNNSVEATVRMAGNLGFRTWLVADGCFTFAKTDWNGTVRSAEEVHAMSLANLEGEYCTVVSSEALLTLDP